MISMSPVYHKVYYQNFHSFWHDHIVHNGLPDSLDGALQRLLYVRSQTFGHCQGPRITVLISLTINTGRPYNNPLGIGTCTGPEQEDNSLSFANDYITYICVNNFFLFLIKGT